MTKEPSVFDFDPLAVKYDRWYETAEGCLYDTLEKRVMRRLIGEAPGDAGLLEVGMGTGWWSRFFSRLGYHVTGVDVAAKMVEAARAKKIPNARFEVADAHQLPFPNDGFSVAAAVTTIEFVRDAEQVIREMVRCTEPGGRLFFGVLNGEGPLNIKRKKQAAGTFAQARFFTAGELRALLEPFGRTSIKPCAFPLSLKLPPILAAPVDDAQALFNRTNGAFIAVKVQL
ncbi:MAG: class I SAM-dependent methyltransferase [Alphaproteobacteria bacterium]